MSYRYSDNYQPPAPMRPPTPMRSPVRSRQLPERQKMIGLLIGFALVSVLVLLAGRVPTRPNVTPLAGPKAATYQTDARKLLTSYGTTAEGKVHMPINVAMDLLVQRGLPVREQAQATPTP